jgi:hypothetical protein
MAGQTLRMRRTNELSCYLLDNSVSVVPVVIFCNCCAVLSSPVKTRNIVQNLRVGDLALAAATMFICVYSLWHLAPSTP